MNIILLGYRGSGKTSIGKQIAAQTWKEFVDVDVEVRKRFANRDIRDIWDTDGEPAFRQAEVEVTRELLSRRDPPGYAPGYVIALGGGTVMQPEARQAVKDAADAQRVYLSCDPQVLAERIAKDSATTGSRPSLNGMGGGIDEINAILADRDPVYREVADVVFDVSHVNVNDAVAYLMRKHL